jgi:hypothetical protein
VDPINELLAAVEGHMQATAVDGAKNAPEDRPDTVMPFGSSLL